MEYIFVFIGSIFSLTGAAFYIRDTLKGETQPNRVTWLMWSIAPLIATVAALSKGLGWIVLPVFMGGLTSILTFASSFVNPRAYWKLNKNDYLCGLLSLLALVLWAITQEPNVAILFSILSDFAASFPTLSKAWHHPESESGSAYFGGVVNSLSTFTAVKTWDFAEVGFSVYNLGIISSILVLIYRKKIGRSLKV
jgi:hypothetical protein